MIVGDILKSLALARLSCKRRCLPPTKTKISSGSTSCLLPPSPFPKAVPEVSPDCCSTGGSVRRDSSVGVGDNSNSPPTAASDNNKKKKRRKRSQPNDDAADGKEGVGGCGGDDERRNMHRQAENTTSGGGGGSKVQRSTKKKNGISGGGGPPKKRPTTIPDNEDHRSPRADVVSAEGGSGSGGGSGGVGGIGHSVVAALGMTPMKRREAHEQKKREAEEAGASASGDESEAALAPGGEATAAAAEKPKTCLRTYNIVTAFTVETLPRPPSWRENACSSRDESSSDSSSSAAAPEPNLSGNSHVARPIRGIQTTYGYVLPDPQTHNCLSVWFTGGTLECNDPENDGAEWRRVFCKDEEDDAASTAGAGSAHSGSSTETGGGMGGALPKWQHLSERAKCLAARLLLGACLPERMEDDGTMSYCLTRPIGGHRTAYIDVLYLDDTLRILRGHHGTVYVFALVPGGGVESAPDGIHEETQPPRRRCHESRAPN